MKSLGRVASIALLVLSLLGAIFQSGSFLFAAGNIEETQSRVSPPQTAIQNSPGATFTLQSDPLPQPAIGIATADFDGDGKTDLAILDSSGVSLLLSDGAGNFRVGARYPVPDPGSIAAGDFNRDGHMDLAVTRASGTVSILLGNGDGTFQSAVNYGVGTGPQGLVTGDFNGDGILDLAVASTNPSGGNPGGGAVSILIGNGDGTFRPSTTLAIGQKPTAITAADLNGSGHLDLVVATTGPFGTVSLLRGNGDGTFEPREDLRTNTNPDAQARSVVAADLNGDGALDLLVANSILSNSGAATEISVLLSSANGSWQSPAVYAIGRTFGGTANTAAQLLVTDLDADGHADLVSVGNAISVQLGNADGTFGAPILYPISEATAGTALDLDDDGLPEVIAVGRDMTVLHNSPGVLLHAPKTLFPPRQVHTSSAPLTATLRNPNHVPVKLSGLRISGDFSQTDDCGSQLSPGSQCSITVTFSPQATGIRNGTLSVLDATGHAASTLVFTGQGVTDGPAVMLSPASLAFSGVRVNTEATKTAQLTNTGTAPLSISSIAVTGGGQFSVSSTCGIGTSIAVNATCTLTVTYSPSFPETQTGAVSITDNAPGSPQTLPLTGSGVSLVFSKTGLNFQPVLVGQTSTSLQTVTVFNLGPGVVDFTAIAITGANAGDFQWLPNSGPQISCAFPGVLRAGDHCFISVSFTPSAVGPRSAMLSVSDDRDPSPATIPITGTGKAIGPKVTFSVTSISFGTVRADSSKNQTLNMTNSGDSPLSISSIGTTGNFSQTNNCGTSLAPGATCAFTVTFAPGSGGAQSGALTVTDNAPGSPQSVSLDGTGQNIVFSKTSLVFPSVPVGQTSASRSVSLFSLAGNPIVIGSLTGPDAADFQVVSISCGPLGNPVEIRRGDPCKIQLTFTPSAEGLRTAQLVFMNENPASGPPVTLPLSATGQGMALARSSSPDSRSGPVEHDSD